MNNKQNGALPIYIIAGDNKAPRAERLELFNHYLNHKGTDIPNGRRNSSSRPVIESIISKFNRQYRPEKFGIEDTNISEGEEGEKITTYSNNIVDDSLNDLRQVAHLTVWKATEKYILK